MSTFLDTSAFVALEVRSDGNHNVAVRAYRKLIKDREDLWTSDFVFDEAMTLLSRRIGPAAAVAWGKRMLTSRLISMVSTETETIRRALAVLDGATDRRYSFTDCCSFVLMRERRVRTVFTFDEDFSTFGLDRVPRRR